MHELLVNCVHRDRKPSHQQWDKKEIKQRSTLSSKTLVQAFGSTVGMGDARIVSSHLLIGGISQARTANIISCLNRAGSCGKTGARTLIMYQRLMTLKLKRISPCLTGFRSDITTSLVHDVISTEWASAFQQSRDAHASCSVTPTILRWSRPNFL